MRLACYILGRLYLVPTNEKGDSVIAEALDSLDGITVVAAAATIEV